MPDRAAEQSVPCEHEPEILAKLKDGPRVYTAFKVIARRAKDGCADCTIQYVAGSGTCYCELTSLSLDPSSSHACLGVTVEPYTGLGWSTGRFYFRWARGGSHVDIKYQSWNVSEVPSWHASKDRQAWYALRTTTKDKSHGYGTIEVDPVSQAAIDRYNGWIKHCDQQHSGCQASSTDILPLRLLDLDAGISNGDGLVLRSTATISSNSHYMALSYCWGDAKPLMTTRTTLAKHEQGISLASLPQTYVDAIRLLRRLGHRYFWIDSMCIVQDNDYERSAEIARMAEIYSNAYLVIIAASAASADQGLLSHRTKYVWRDCRLASNISTGAVRCRAALHRSGYAPQPLGDPCVGSPVQKRGWTLQEHLLAARCLVFRDEEAVWECRAGCKCECRGNELPETEPPVYDPMLIQRSITLSDADSRWLSYWQTLILTYSERSVRVPTDKLPAISALATTIGAKRSADYLAGLWRPCLLDQLLWSRRDYHANYLFGENTGNVFVAPAWSWASIPYPISTYRVEGSLTRDEHWHSQHPHVGRNAEVINAYCHTGEQEPFGAVTDGQISVIGLSCKAVLEYLPNQNDLLHLQLSPPQGHESNVRLEHIIFDTPVRSASRGGGAKPLVLERDMDVIFKHPSSEIKDRAWKGEVTMLHVKCCVWLILNPSTRGDTQFERLGMLDLSNGSYEYLLVLHDRMLAAAVYYQITLL